MRVRLLGRQPDQWRLRRVVLVFFLVWNVLSAGPVQSLGRGPGGEAPVEAPKNLHPTVPKSGSKIDHKHLNGYAFFHVHRSTKSQKSSRRSKILNSQVFYQKQNVYILYFQLHNVSQISKASKESQISAKVAPTRYNIRVILLKNFFILLWPQRHLGLCLICLEVKNNHQKSSRLQSLSRGSKYWAVLRLFVLQVFQNPSKTVRTAQRREFVF